MQNIKITKKNNGYHSYNIKPDMNSLVAIHKSCVTTCQLGPLLWSSYTSLNADVYGLESPNHDGLLGTFFTVVSQGIEKVVFL